MKSIILPCTPAECEKIVSGDISVLIRKKTSERNIVQGLYLRNERK